MTTARILPAALLCALALSACQKREPQSPAAQETASAPARLPVAEPPLDRRAVLLALGEAASLFAAGRDDAALQTRLDGKSFAVRLRFGCPGVASAGRGWTFDEAERVLRIEAAPDLALGDPALGALTDFQPESVEGYRFERPWMLDAACPALPAPAGLADEGLAGEGKAAGPAAGDEEEPVLAAPTAVFGMAQFYSEEDSRAHRREARPYAVTIRLALDEMPSVRGYDLVLSGRLSRLPGGKVVMCHGGGPDAAPGCIVSVRFDRVSITQPGGEVIAEWSSA